MKNTLLTLFSLTFSYGTLLADETLTTEQLSIKFITGSLSTEEQKTFSRKASLTFDEFHTSFSALKYAEKKEFTPSQLKTAAKRLSQSKAKSYRESTYGIQLNWYISVTDDEKVLANPIISKIDTDCTAYKAGLRKGDVITRINGQSTTSEHCLEITHIFLRLYPSTEPLTFQVKRAPQPDKATTRLSIKKLTEDFTFKLAE